MARIPLTEIPNAPGTTMGPTGDNLGGVNLMGAASMLQRKTIAQGSFDGPAEGMAALGRGIANAGAGIGAFTEAMGRKKILDDKVKIIGANDALAQFAQDFEVNQTGIGSDTNSWEPELVKGLGKRTKELLADKALSPEAKERIQQDAQRFTLKAATQIRAKSIATSAELAKKTYLGAGERALDAGNLTLHDAYVDAAVADKALWPEEGAKIKESAKQIHEFNTAAKLAKVDPIAASEQLADEGNFPTLAPRQRLQLQDASEREQVQKERDGFEMTATAIETGHYNTLQDIPEEVHKYFTPETWLKVGVMLEKSEPFTYAKMDSLTRQVESLDPSKDDKGRARFDVERAARDFPAPWREQIMDAVRKKYDGTGDAGSFTTEQLNGKIEAAFKNKQFGDFDAELAAEGDAGEMAKMEAAFKKKLQLRTDIANWKKANPQGDEVKANEFLNQRLKVPGLQQPLIENWWQRSWFGGKPDPIKEPAPAPPVQNKLKYDEILKKHTGGKTGSALGKGLPAPLRGHAADFEEAASQYGLDPHLLAAISAFETGGGTSKAFREKKNAMGISNAKGPIALQSVRDSIFRQARTLADPSGPYAGLKTIEQIAAVYSPPGAGNDPNGTNAQWPKGVRMWLAKIKKGEA